MTIIPNISRLKKSAMSINDVPNAITANDVKMELISQFDWFENIPKEQLDKLIDETPNEEFATIAKEINDEVIPLVLDDFYIKKYYTKEFSIELRWLLAHALYIDKFALVIQLMNGNQPAAPDIFNRRLMLTLPVYDTRKLRQLQAEGYISYAKDNSSKPLDDISDSQLTRMIATAHEVAIERVLKHYPKTPDIIAKYTEERLNIHTNEFWIKHNIR